MNFEEFLIENKCLKAFCENVRDYNKDRERLKLKGRAKINSFLWSDTSQGIHYWNQLNNLSLECGITERQTYEYFENHPCLSIKPPKCLRRL